MQVGTIVGNTKGNLSEIEMVRLDKGDKFTQGKSTDAVPLWDVVHQCGCKKQGKVGKSHRLTKRESIDWFIKKYDGIAVDKKKTKV